MSFFQRLKRAILPAPKTAPDTKRATIQDRSDYKGTWDALASDQEAAYRYVAGRDYTDDQAMDTLAEKTAERLDAFTGIFPQDRILEIGCGVGRMGKVLSQRAAHWTGSDISGNMLSYAAQRLEGIENVSLIELPRPNLRRFDADSFSLVYCTVVFMHLLEWDRFRYVQDMFRVLEPGGRCYFDNADIASDGGWEVFMAGFNFPVRRRPAQISMTSTGEELEAYAKRAGFESVNVHRWDGWVAVSATKPQ
jgi:ubiquinone/menaquinone biosynthesis C-methylase UbiE